MKSTNPHEFAVCMGMDAMRLCLGQKPRNFSMAEVVAWMRAMSRATLAAIGGTP